MSAQLCSMVRCCADDVAGGLIRHICKALEEVGILEKSSSIKGGRKLTGSGQRDMDLIAGVFWYWCLSLCLTGCSQQWWK